MKAILQRVKSASVTVDNQLVSSISRGILVFAAVNQHDTKKEAESLAGKVLKMKMWDDEAGTGKWKRNVQEIAGEVLCVSQFTLYAVTRKGNKPDFHRSASPALARELYEHFVQKVKEGYQAERVKDGVFQAMMDVALVNDGPVTLEIEAEAKVVEDKKENPAEAKKEKSPQGQKKETSNDTKGEHVEP